MSLLNFVANRIRLPDLISHKVQPAHKKHQSVLLSDASLSISTREFVRQAFA